MSGGRIVVVMNHGRSDVETAATLSRRISKLADKGDRLFGFHSLRVLRKRLSRHAATSSLETCLVQRILRRSQELLRVRDLRGVVLRIDFDERRYGPNPRAHFSCFRSGTNDRT